jgi:glutaredoxin-related protein
VTRKLKQLWILSETKEETEGNNKVEVGDVAKELERILHQTDSSEEMDGIEQEKSVGDDVIEMD